MVSVSQAVDRSVVEESGQYSLGKIVLIWALAALPMGLVVWSISP